MNEPTALLALKTAQTPEYRAEKSWTNDLSRGFAVDRPALATNIMQKLNVTDCHLLCKAQRVFAQDSPVRPRNLSAGAQSAKIRQCHPLLLWPFGIFTFSFFASISFLFRVIYLVTFFLGVLLVFIATAPADRLVAFESVVVCKDFMKTCPQPS